MVSVCPDASLRRRVTNEAGAYRVAMASFKEPCALPGHEWYFYEANGNVGQLMDATDTDNITLAAHYEYDPYGNTIASSGLYASSNPYRFSTKWFDDELDYPNTSSDGLYYYGYRYYLLRLGRWISRDPLGFLAPGGKHTASVVRQAALRRQDAYPFTSNNPTNRTDSLGLFSVGLYDGAGKGRGGEEDRDKDKCKKRRRNKCRIADGATFRKGASKCDHAIDISSVDDAVEKPRAYLRTSNNKIHDLYIFDHGFPSCQELGTFSLFPMLPAWRRL